MGILTPVGASCARKTIRVVTQLAFAFSLGLVSNAATAVPVPTGAFAQVLQMGGNAYSDWDPSDLGTGGGYTFQTTAEASGSGNDGFAFVSSDLVSGTVRMAATVDSAIDYNSPPSVRMEGGIRDIVNFNLGGDTSALVSFSGHIEAQISGPARLDYKVVLSRCSAAGCDAGQTTTVAILNQYVSNINEDLLFDNGGAGYLILSGFSYLLDFRVSGFVNDGGMISGMDTFAVDFVLPEGVTFTSGSGVLLTATNQPDPSIPEPSVLALMLAGLGLIGWHARRRA